MTDDNGGTLGQGLQIFSIKSQGVNIFGFVSHMALVTAMQLTCCRTKAVQMKCKARRNKTASTETGGRPMDCGVPTPALRECGRNILKGALK